MAVVGWVLIVIGVVFELLAAAGAARRIAQGTSITADEGPFGWLIELIKALAAAPIWLACFAVGLVLIYIGASMTGNALNLPTT